MNKQDNKLAFSVVATLLAGIALVYTMIMYPQIIFAVAGIGLVFITAAYILTQNIISYINRRDTSLDVHIKNSVDGISSQIENMNHAQTQLEKATFLYTKQTAQTLSTLENNYTESQDALFRNLEALTTAQNKSTKLMIKYDQSNTTKLISTLKEVRNQLSETMIQGFDQIQPNNTELIETLEDIVTYLKNQPTGMDQSMGLQLNNVAHELQNISNSIQRAQIAVPQMAVTPVAQAVAPVAPATAPTVTEEPKAEVVSATETVAEDTTITEDTLTKESETSVETNIKETSIQETVNPEADIEELLAEDTANEEVMEKTEVPVEEAVEDVVEEKTSLDASDLDALFADIAGDIEENEEIAEAEEVSQATPEPAKVEPVLDDPNKQLSADEIAALFAAAEPTPKKEEPAVEEVEEEPFKPTFTVVGKEDDIKEEAEPVKVEPVSDDPNKQLSADEIAALFAAAEPAPKKEEKAPEPVKVEPVSDDPNKQLSADEIAALFAAAEPAPKKEEKAPEPVKVEPISDDPNKQLSPDEIAALFASMG